MSAACAQSAPLDEQLVAVGWVQAAGEVRIYSRKEDLGKLYDASCVSGVIVKGQTLPSRLQNRHVSVYGMLVDVEQFNQMALKGITAGIGNYCNSSKIAIITRIVETPAGKDSH